MSVRRQGWTVKWEDDGATQLSDLVRLSTGESIFLQQSGRRQSTFISKPNRVGPIFSITILW